MSLSRREPHSSRQSRRHQSSQSCLPWRTTQLAAALSQVCRDRASTSLAYRSSRPILLASASSCSARLSPASAGWRSWPMSAILAPCLNWPRFRRPPARSALRSLRSKSGERRISPPPSRRSTAAWTHFISRPMRSYPPTGFASTPWLSPRDCRRCTVCGRMSNGRSDVLWSELHGPVPARRGVSRQDFAWGEARRHPRRTADQIRSCNQSDHREGAWPRSAADAARARRRGDRMKRREFMTLLGGAAAAWPLAARAQQTARLPRIGILWPNPVTASGHFVDAFRQGLGELGYVEGRNMTIEFRTAEGTMERLPDLAAELVRLPVEVILTATSPTIRAAQQATR